MPQRHLRVGGVLELRGKAEGTSPEGDEAHSRRAYLEVPRPRERRSVGPGADLNLRRLGDSCPLGPGLCRMCC